MAETRNTRIMGQLAQEARENARRYWAGKAESICLIPGCGLRAIVPTHFCAEHKAHAR